MKLKTTLGNLFARGWIKCNTDAYLNLQGKWGLEAFYKNHKGKTMATNTWFVNDDDNSTTGETMMINKAIEMTLKSCFIKFVFEMNNKWVVRMMM